MNNRLKEELFKERDVNGTIPSIIGIILFYFLCCPIVYKIYIEPIIKYREDNTLWAIFFIQFIFIVILIPIFKGSFYFSKIAVRKYKLSNNDDKPFRIFLNKLNEFSLMVSKILICAIIIAILITLFI